MEGGGEDASLPPIANLSLSKANMSGTGAANPSHASTRRSTLNNYYDTAGGATGGYKAKAAAVAGTGVAGGGGVGGGAAAGGGAGGGGAGAAGQAGAAGGAVGRRQSMGVVPGKYAAVGKQQVQVHVPAGAAGAAGGMGLAGGHQARQEPTSAVKYKANVGKSNSKYISPYSLRQLAGQNTGQA